MGEHPSLIAEHDGHYQVFALKPSMEAWGGWPYYFALDNGGLWFAVPRNNPGVANWYNREPLGYVPLAVQIELLPKERARALALLWMQGGKEFEASR